MDFPITKVENVEGAVKQADSQLKTYTSLEQLGLDKGTVTWGSLKDAMPNNSILLLLTNNVQSPKLDLPKSNNVRLHIVNYDKVLIINACPVDAFELFWAKVTSGGHQGWVEMAQNGKLSMPYTGASGISVSVNSLTGNGYTAPNDGWVVVACTSKANNNASWVRLYNSARQALSVSQSAYNGETARLLMPVAKGGVIKLSKGDNITVDQAYFYPAQSEV